MPKQLEKHVEIDFSPSEPPNRASEEECLLHNPQTGPADGEDRSKGV